MMRYSLLLCLTTILSAQTLYVPNGTSGIAGSTNGNVGIGTSSPKHPLDVKGGISTAYLIDSPGQWNVALTAAVTVSGGILDEGGPGGRSGDAKWRVTATGQWIQFDLGGFPYTSIDTIAFGTHWRGDSRFIPSGYVLEGSPDGTNWTNFATVTGNTEVAVSHATTGYMRFVRLTVTAFQPGQSAANIAGFKILTGSMGASSGTELWGLNINDNSAVLTSVGNVGIGTSTPTHKLSVNGTIRAKEVIVDTGWADHVFAEDYHLMPLAEVEDHIHQAKHLPGIPSADEVTRNGISVGDMQAKLLEKIEELTLHVIQQSKDIESLRRENAKLRQRFDQLD